jgi:hypothetical protein
MASTKIQSEQIEDGAITAAKIADGAIVASEVADNAITTAKINADAVTSAKIDTNIDIAGTFDVTGATTLDSTLAVAGDANFDSGTLFVDVSANKIGIGTTSPTRTVDINHASTAPDLRLGCDGNDAPMIIFDADVSSAGDTVSHLVWRWNNTDIALITGFAGSDTTNKDDGGLSFSTRTSGSATAERMRIDTSGNVLVGQLTASSGTVGTSIRPDGRVFFCADGNYSAHFNRKSSDGAIAHFAKDDTIVGSIGTISGQPYFTGATAGGFQISHLNSTNAVIVPVTAAGANSDATHDIGYTGKRFRNIVLSGSVTAPSGFLGGTNGGLRIHSGGTKFFNVTEANAARDGIMDIGAADARFKNLYLSGGAYLGGTAAANALDDYEEGSWSPSVSGATTSINDAHYVKIGAFVHINTYFTFSSLPNNSTMFKIDGLPYAIQGGATYGGGSLSYTHAANTADLQPLISTGTSYIYFHETDGNSAVVTNANMYGRFANGAGYIILSMNYMTAF